jgi:hypothetical protein
MMDSREAAFVLGQRYAFATVALVVAILSFVNLAGLEKGILALVLAVKALARTPAPALAMRRGWARGGAALATAHLVLVLAVILLNLERIPRLIEAFRALSDLR